MGSRSLPRQTLPTFQVFVVLLIPSGLALIVAAVIYLKRGTIGLPENLDSQTHEEDDWRVDRHESPAVYWSLIAAMFIGGVVFFGVGCVQVFKS